MVRVNVFNILMFSHLVSLLSTAEDQLKCPSSFNCGDLETIQFPFTTTERPDCGILALHGCGNDSFLPKRIQLKRELHEVQSIDHSTIFVRDKSLRQRLQSRSCKIFNSNYNPNLPPTSPLASFDMKYNITLFKCNKSLHIPLSKHLLSYTNCSNYNIYYFPLNFKLPMPYKPPSSFARCSTIQLPVKDEAGSNDPFTFIASEIPVEVRLSEECAKCYHPERGMCKLDSKGKFLCAKVMSEIWKALLATVVGAGALFFVLFYYLARLWKCKSKAHQDFEAFLQSHGPLPVRRYSYSVIKKITKSFKEKLGQGGYGEVFKGKLDDGCPIAVKILSESKGNGEEFINEVASISRTSHVNIVTLLGFCFEGSKRALVYEYMSNGSLEKFIYETNPSMNNHLLDTEILYQIAIGVARGLEYLHKGCNTRILHFDIKPHNILLDENFCPKISDFGLAKICPKKESVVSMIGTRGTIGYIAPEIFSRHFGGVSHKSDVYSYGMMVLEMVGGRKNINVEVDHTSEIYFPYWIHKRLELNQEFALRSITNENDKSKIRKMVTVSLWCVQTNPSDRPTIGRVVEMLEGRVETLQIPPSPFLSSSPPRSLPSSPTH